MSDLVPVVCFAAGFGAVVALTLAGGRRRLRRHRGDLHAWARANTWTLTRKPVVDWGSRLPGGNKYGVSLALSGTMAGRATSIGEYSYTESSSTSRTPGTTSVTHEYVVVVVHLEHPSAYLGVQTRSLLGRWGHTLYGLGAEIGHDAFDEQFRVVGDPAEATYSIGPALIAEHLAGTVPPWTLYGSELLACYPGELVPDRVKELAAPVHRVADLLTLSFREAGAGR